MPPNSNSSMISWWFQGLGILVPKGLKNLFSPAKKKILLQLQGDQLAVIWPNQKKNDQQPSIYNIQQNDDRNSLLKRLGKFNKDKHDFSLCIPAKKGLQNALKLPLNAEPNLANILEFEIDRQTPFTRDQVYSGYRILNKDPATNTLNVDLNVIPKKNVDPQLAELKKIGLIPQVVELLNDRPDESINVLPKSIEDSGNKSTRHFNIILSLLALALTTGAIALPFMQLDTAIKQTDLEIETSKKGALEVNKLRSVWEQALEKQNFINEKVSSRKSVTMIINELTNIIPDHSWLTRLQVRENTVRLQGESSAATSLIGIIEQSVYFKGVRFQSPVTTNISTGGDRFQIMTELTEKEIPSNDQQESE